MIDLPKITRKPLIKALIFDVKICLSIIDMVSMNTMHGISFQEEMDKREISIVCSIKIFFIACAFNHYCFSAEYIS